jgi:hypothetical protein
VVKVRGRRSDTHRYEDGGENTKDVGHENVYMTSRMYSRNLMDR